MSNAEKSPGQIAFEAYNESKGGLTYDGKPIPPWESLEGATGEAVKRAWEHGASAVIDAQIALMMAAPGHMIERARKSVEVHSGRSRESSLALTKLDEAADVARRDPDGGAAMNARPWSLKWWTILLSTIGGVLAAAPAAALLMPPDWRAPVVSVVGVLAILVVAVLRSALFDADQDGTPDALQPKKPPRVPPLAVLLVVLCVSGCGAASRVGVAVACPSLILAIGEDTTRTPERARADIDQVSEVCHRFPADAQEETP